MFKKLKFWFEFLKEVITTYERLVDSHGFNPIGNKTVKRQTNNVQSNKRD